MATVAALALCAMAALSAHGDLHEQIAAASRAIAARPHDAPLYLARGELYRTHHDTAPALADYATALRLDPTLDAAHLARGRLLMEARRPAEALKDLDRFLARRPDHADALVVRARTRTALGDAPRAREDYDRAVSTSANPDWFIERARLVRSSAGAATAIDGLNQGLAQLGPVLTLTLEAIDCELSLGRHDAALDRLDRLVAVSGAHPQWSLQRGDILLAAGRPAEARRAFSTAIDELHALPPARRRTRQNAALRARAVSALEHLDTITRNP